MLLEHLFKTFLAGLLFTSSYNPGSQEDKQLDLRELASLETLETNIQETIKLVIEKIKNGNIDQAIKDLEPIENVKWLIPSIIRRAYKEESKMCINVLDFIVRINLNPNPTSTDWRDQVPTNLVKAIAFEALFTIISKQTYYAPSELSECLIQLGWQAKELQKRLHSTEYSTSDNLETVISGLPSSVRYLLLNSIHIRRNPTQCEDVDKKTLGDYQEWQPESIEYEGERGGEYFTLEDKLGLNQPLEADVKEERVYLGQNDGTRKPERLWKPILVSNEQLQFQHKASGKYLSYEDESSCYKYVLSDKPTNWYISNWV